MPDSSTIQEFLVGIGYKVDQSSQQRFTSGVAEANKATAGLEQAIRRLHTAIDELGEKFKTSSDEPVRKFTDGTRKITTSMEGLRKGTIELGRLALATGGAFAAGIIEVTKSFTELLHMSERVNVSVGQLVALRNASEQAGRGAEYLEGMLQKISIAMATGGRGMDVIIDRFIRLSGVAGAETWEKSTNKAKTSLIALVGIAKLAQTDMARAISEAQALGLGPTDVLDISALAPGEKKGGKTVAEHMLELNERAAARIDDEQVKRVTASLSKLQETLASIRQGFWAIFVQGMDESLPEIHKWATAIDDAVDKLREWNKTHPKVAQAEVWVAIATGMTTVAGVVLRLGFGVNILRTALSLFTPWGIAFALAAKAVYDNWGPISVFLKTQFDKIQDDFERHDWKKLGKDLGDAIREGLTGIDKWLTEQLKDLDKQTAEFNAAIRPVVDALVKQFAKAVWEAIQEDPDIKHIKEWWNWLFPGTATTAAPTTHGRGTPPPESKEDELADRLAQVFGQGPSWQLGVGTPAARGRGAQGAAQPLDAATAAALSPGLLGPLEERFRGPSWQIGGAKPGDPWSGLPPLNLPHMQRGGVVTANLHEGEMVLPPGISRGLRAIIQGMEQAHGGGFDEPRGIQRLGDWLTGAGGAVPKVIIDNWDELLRKAKEEVPASVGQAAAGLWGGRGVGGPGGRLGGGGRFGEGPALGEPTAEEKERIDLLEKTIYELESSSGKNVSTSSAGARGPMQIMPGTWAQYARPGEDIDNPEQNRAVGRRIIEDLYQKFHGDMEAVLRAYNRGPNATGPDPEETQRYIARGRAMWRAPGGAVAGAPATGVHPELHAAMQAAMDSVLPPGYTAKLLSGVRTGKPGSAHFSGFAEDWQIIGPQGPISTSGADTTGLYRKAAVAALANLMRTNPALAARFAWGGHFGTQLGGGGPPDLEHYDISPLGPRGHYGDPMGERAEAAALAQLDRMRNTALAGGVSMHKPELFRPAGDTNINVVHNVTVNGDGGDPHATERRYRETHRRLHADLIRHLKPAIA